MMSRHKRLPPPRPPKDKVYPTSRVGQSQSVKEDLVFRRNAEPSLVSVGGEEVRAGEEMSMSNLDTNPLG